MITFVDKNEQRVSARKRHMTKKIKEDVEREIADQMQAANRRETLPAMWTPRNAATH